MIPNPAFTHDILTDVITRGATTVDKRKLLFALGAKQDRASAWGRLLDVWEELDQPRNSLRAYAVWDTTLILASEAAPRKAMALEVVKEWA